MSIKKKEELYTFQKEEDEKHFDLGHEESDPPMPLTVTSRVLYMLGDITAGPAYRFAQWLELVRKRSGRYRSSGFPHRPQRTASMPLGFKEAINDVKSSPPEQLVEISLWERLGKADICDIESSSFSWNMLSSLHHTEHSSNTEHSEEEANKALEVTVNSGGVVFFALFRQPPEYTESTGKEAAAVIKFSSSRMATQSERLGYELGKWLGVRTPQARVVHNSSEEWLQIKDATEKAKVAAINEGDEGGELTCSELLEALELSRCLLLMNYIHGSPLLESSYPFESKETAKKTASALGRVLMLDLVIRNEDRLPCRHLWWRGNSANLLYAEKVNSTNIDTLESSFDSAIKMYQPRIVRALEKERRASSVDSKLNTSNSVSASQSSDVFDIAESPKSSCSSLRSQISIESIVSESHVVVIDSGVPRRPPAGKRVNDQEKYPRLIELLINSSPYASDLLYEVTGGKLGSPSEDSGTLSDTISVVNSFRSGFRAAFRDLQGFHIFLLTLHQKLDSLLRVYFSIINRVSGDTDRDDSLFSPSPSQFGGGGGSGMYSPSTPNKERMVHENHSDLNELDLQNTTHKPSSSGVKDGSELSSPHSRDSWQGKSNPNRWSSEGLHRLRLTSKLRDFQKFAKVDGELNKELEQWNETLKNDAVKLCQENNFITGFFEGNDNSYAVDAYELKVRLEHILERIALISDAANTEKPSSVSNFLFIGGALAARSVYTLQHLGITNILCLCTNDIGQSDSQFPDLFEYKNFSVCDNEDSNINVIFEEAHDYVDHVEQIGGKVLVHCFEGRSRSATLVLAYLMLRKKLNLLQAWNSLKRVHRRAQPNDGFARILLELDKKLHGKVSMEWQQRKPAMKICPMCGRNAGLSSSSLKLHLQKAHKRFSSGSVDSAMTMEIQKALEALKISRGGSVSPTPSQSQSSMTMIDG